MGRRRAAFRRGMLCRGEGVGYMVLSSEAAGIGSVEARTVEGVAVPCSCHEVGDARQRELLAPKARRAWVAAVPLLAKDCELVIHGMAGEEETQVFPCLASKLSSRALTLARPEAAALLRGFERVQGKGTVGLRIGEPWPAYDGKVVWRIQVAFPVDGTDAAPWLRVFDESACAQHAGLVLMEDHTVPCRRDPAFLERVVTFSCALPSGLTSFYVRAGLDEGGRTLAEGFAGMNAPRAVAWAANVRRRIAGASGDERYGQWFEENRATAAELARQREARPPSACTARPLISVVLVAGGADPLSVREAARSVGRQSYGSWELVVAVWRGREQDVRGALGASLDGRAQVVGVAAGGPVAAVNAGIEAAQGAYVAFLGPDGILEPDALWHVAQQVTTTPEADLLYTDEDQAVGGRVCAPDFKAFPNRGKLYGRNYVGNLMVVSRHALGRMAYADEAVEGAEAYDLALRAFEAAREVVHIPRVLYHTQVEEPMGGEGACLSSLGYGRQRQARAHEAGRRALAGHLGRRGLEAQVVSGPCAGTYRVRFAVSDPAPKVSIVIPTRDHADLLETCVRSILEMSSYPSFEVVLVENYSKEPKTFALYRRLAAEDARVRTVTWTSEDGEAFNYSALVNYGVSRSDGAFVLLLNNDTEVMAPAWIEELVGCLMRPEVGVAGAKLLFGDGLIQHVGMVANPSGGNCHVCQNLTRDAAGPGLAAALPGDYAMVTGACQLVSRALYEELGGYDERLAVGFNDSDFCLRAFEAGYVSSVAPHALLHHREFSSRGREADDMRLRERYRAEKAYYLTKHAAFFAAGDPALNPNLDPWSGYFELGCGQAT